MSKQKNTKTIQPKKERIDRVSSVSKNFDAFTSEANQPNTVVLLLDSNEETIILRVLHHLDKYASKSIDNYETLYTNNILRPLLNHCDSNHLFIRRFAFKILSQMFKVPAANDELLAMQSVFSIALNTYTQIEDSFLSEYASIVLNYFCNDSNWLTVLFENRDFVQVLYFKCSQTSDPDVLWHGLEILKRISANADGLQMLFEFPFEFLLTTVKSEFPIIQNCGLDIFLNLTNSDSSYYINRFKSSEFLLEMFSILGNIEQCDLHPKVIDLLQRLMRFPPIAEVFYKEIYFQVYLNFFENTAQYKVPAIGVFSELAQYPGAHELLFDHEICERLIEFLQKSPSYDVALGIKYFASYPPALEKFVKSNVVSLLFDFLKNDKQPWIDRKEAGKTLNTLFAASTEACHEILPCNGKSVIINLGYLNEEDTPLEIKMILARMLLLLSKHSDIREKIMVDEMAKCLFFMITTYEECRILLVELVKCLGAYVTEECLRNEIIKSKIFTTITEILSTPVRTVLHKSLCDFIATGARYPKLCDTFIDKKVLDCLLADTDALAECSTWSPAIESILSHSLPTKFALRGRLDLADVTQEGFYATKKIWINVRMLRFMFTEECSPRRTIFLCNFNHLPPTPEEREDSGESLRQETHHGSFDSICYNRRPYDSNLPAYLQTLQNRLQINKLPISNVNTLNITDTVRVIHILADLVCTRICSKTKTPYTTSIPSVPKESNTDYGSLASCTCDDVLDDMIKEHLQKLKHHLHSNIIPIGYIKIGSYFEKSLLFKVLADKINLRCTLVMDKNWQMVWNEVAIPLYDKNEKCGDINEAGEMPQPTHIVDLMDHPGNIYAIGCNLALKYQQC